MNLSVKPLRCSCGHLIMDNEGSPVKSTEVTKAQAGEARAWRTFQHFQLRWGTHGRGWKAPLSSSGLDRSQLRERAAVVPSPPVLSFSKSTRIFRHAVESMSVHFLMSVADQRSKAVTQTSCLPRTVLRRKYQLWRR